MSALELLRAAIARLGRATEPETLRGAARAVGEGFVRGAEEHPGMFTQGRLFADTPEGLAAQFGTLPLERLGPGAPGFLGSFDYRIRMPKQTGQYDERQLLASIYQGVPHLLGSPDAGRHTLSAINSGKVKANAPIHVFDTADLRGGSGQGTRLYAHAFGNLANGDPEAVNITNGLSGQNMFRRSLNMASALERDPRLANRLIATPSQLRDLPLDPEKFHRLSPLEQIGALQLAAGRRTLRALEQAATDQGTAFSRPAEIQELERLKAMMDVSLGAAFSPQRNLEPVSRIFNRSSKAESNPLGERTIRKALLADDLAQGKPFEDLYDQFGGLEFRSGGKV